MTEAPERIDHLHARGTDGVIRTLDEHYNSQKDVDQDPYGAWLAIQNLWTSLETSQTRVRELEEALEKIDLCFDGSHMARTIATAALRGSTND